MKSYRQITHLGVATLIPALILWGTLHTAVSAPKELNNFDLTSCTIPADQIKKGGPPRDGIPALTTPETIPADEASYLQNTDKVIGVEINGKARAYPLRILVWHENVNDVLADRPIAVTYCPLCHSATVFDRKIDNKVREFGISGLLWNSNVLLYDKKAKGNSSLWSQVAMRAVCGPAAKKGFKLQLLPSRLLRWDQWQKEHPSTTVLARETGYKRDYSRTPYKRYFSTQKLMFPVNASDSQLAEYPKKEQLVVIRIDDQIKGYPFSEVTAAANADGIVKDTVADVHVRLKYSSETKTITVSPAEKLSQKQDFGVAYMFWFAWKSVYPEAPVYNSDTANGN